MVRISFRVRVSVGVRVRIESLDDLAATVLKIIIYSSSQ